MDPTRFTQKSPGKVVKISHPKEDWAFIPDNLPPVWEPTYEILQLLAEAKYSLGELNGIGQVLPNANLLMRPLQSREAITSSRLEGTYATPEQLLLFEIDTDVRSEESKPWREVHNYKVAISHGCKLLEQLPFCGRILNEIHEKLFSGIANSVSQPGSFRRWQVQIGTTGRFIPPPHTHLQNLMSQLERHWNSKSKLDPLIAAFISHYQFEAIHPYEDGNGRVGRVLLALMIYKSFQHKVPFLYMSAYFERYKDEYIQNLFRVSTEGDWDRWVMFCLEGVRVQAKDSIVRCKRFLDLKQKFIDRIPTGPRLDRIVELLFETPLVVISQIERKFDVSFPTAKKDLIKLAEAGILKEVNNVRPAYFYSHEIMEIAYSDQYVNPSTAA